MVGNIKKMASIQKEIEKALKRLLKKKTSK